MRGLGCHGVCHLGLYEQHVSVRTTRVCMNNLCLYRTTCVSVCLQIVASPPACALFLNDHTCIRRHTHTHTHTLTPCAYLDTKVSLYLQSFSFSRTLSLTPLFPTLRLPVSPSPPLYLFSSRLGNGGAHTPSVSLCQQTGSW